MDGIQFLSLLPDESISAAFLDPQYRGVLDKLAYGNEGKGRGKERAALQQMNEGDDPPVYRRNWARLETVRGICFCGWTSFTCAKVSAAGTATRRSKSST